MCLPRHPNGRPLGLRQRASGYSFSSIARRRTGGEAPTACCRTEFFGEPEFTFTALPQGSHEALNEFGHPHGRNPGHPRRSPSRRFPDPRNLRLVGSAEGSATRDRLLLQSVRRVLPWLSL